MGPTAWRFLTSFMLLHLAFETVYTMPQPHSIRQVSSVAKAGLAWSNGPTSEIDQFRTTGKVQWLYTWSSSSLDTDLEFVPMLWGATQVSQWESTINSTILERHVTHVLGFNEPDQAGQSNLSPAAGASLWRAQIEPLKTQGILLGTPAPSSAPSGKQWLEEWVVACGGCTVDFVALHWYGIDSTAFIEYLEEFHETFQKPIWVTEWACQNVNAGQQCSQQDIVNFMNATQSFMDESDWVERYAWFGVGQGGALMDSMGHITPLGDQYIGAAVPDVSTD